MEQFQRGRTKGAGLKNITRRSTGKKSTVPRGMNPGSRCKSVQVMQGNGVALPARPVCDKPVSARTRWNLFGARGVVQGGPGPARRRDRLHSGDARRLRPSGSPGAGRAPSSDPSPATGRPGSPVPYRSVPRACRRELVARCPTPGTRPADWPTGLPQACSAGPSGPDS